MPHYVYFLKNPEGKLYIGQTANIKSRLLRHTSGQGARFIKDHQNFQLVYYEKLPTLQDAMKREKQLKGWTRVKKEALIAGDLELLKRL